MATDSEYGYIDTSVSYGSSTLTQDSEFGFLDVSVDFQGALYFDSNPGFLDTEVQAMRPVDFWDIVDSIRVPMWTRGLLNAEQERNNLKWGEFFPNENTTGVFDESVLEEINGNVIYSIPGETVRNFHFRGRVTVMAGNVRFINCKFTGPAVGTLSDGIIMATHQNVVNLVFQDCTIAPENPSHVTNCINGHRFKFIRVNAYHGVDIIGAIGNLSNDDVGIIVEGSWLHDMAMYNTTTQSDRITHNDLIQWHGMLMLWILGSRLEGNVSPDIGCASDPPVGIYNVSPDFTGNPYYPNLYGFSCVMGSPARKLMGGFILRKSWLDWGAVGLNFSGPSSALFPDGGIIEDNFFGTNWRLSPDHAILAKQSQPIVISGNHRWNKASPFDKSVSFNVRKNG